MPNIPLLGLSSFVHLGIILAHRIFKWSERKTEKVIRDLGVSVYVLGCFIIAIIFFIISCFAAFLIGISFNDQNSNLHTFNRLAPHVIQFDTQSLHAEILSTFPEMRPLVHGISLSALYEFLVVVFFILLSLLVSRVNLFKEKVRPQKTRSAVFLRVSTLVIGSIIIFIAATSVTIRVTTWLHFPFSSAQNLSVRQ